MFQKIIKIFKKKAVHGRDDFFKGIIIENLEPAKQKMIKGVIELSERNAREIMIPRVDVLALPDNIKLKDMIERVHESGFSRIPVYKESIDNIIGILYNKDLLKYVIEKPKKFQLEKILHKPFFVPETMALDDLLLQFQKRRLHLALVVDEYGGMSGVITLEDIIEEIVGDIEDEFDDDVPEMQKIRENIYRVDSRMTISDFNEETGLALPTDDFDTIGGLVLDLFGRVPQKNEAIGHEGMLFRVNSVKGTRIRQVTIRIPREKIKQ
ncbi:MAG: hemolysin family protein [Spirochaetes bacterium]|nr:hemolysin family protein [Spirochaetota bacterium]